MKVNIFGTDYDVKYGVYSIFAPYNMNVGQIAGYIEPIDKAIHIDTFDPVMFQKYPGLVDKVVWFDLFSALVYEAHKVELWEAEDENVDAFEVASLIADHMEELYDAFLMIQVDITHYISKKGLLK